MRTVGEQASQNLTVCLHKQRPCRDHYLGHFRGPQCRRLRRARTGTDVSVKAIQVQESRSSTNTEAASRHGSEADVPATSEPRQIAVLRAQKSATLALREGPRPLAEYMALPASQYSVLDAKRIERIDDDTFRCYVGGLKLFNFAIYPVLTVSVIVTERGPTVKLLSTKLEGSPAVVAANDRFTATMTNDVRWSSGPAPDLLELGSDTSIQVALEVPGWFQMVPVSAIERTGCSVMQRVLNKMVPRFLKQLQADYELWASGDGSRKPIGDGQL